MRIKDALYAWDAGGEIEVGPWDSDRDWSAKYLNTGGACYSHVQEASDLRSRLILMVEFNHIVTRDKVDPLKAHRAFMKIDEYRDLMSEDMPA